MAENFKERFDMAVGKAATFVSEKKSKAVEYFDGKQKLYKTKSALDEANKRLDNLFNELGRTSYYRKSTVPGRVSADIKEEIKATLTEIDALQKAYDELKPVDEEE